MGAKKPCSKLNIHHYCQRPCGLGGALGNNHKAQIRPQFGSGLFAQAAAFVVDQAITAGMMPDRSKLPERVAAYKPPSKKHRRGQIMVFRSPMFGSSGLR